MIDRLDEMAAPERSIIAECFDECVWVGFAGGSDVLGAVRALGHAVRSGDDAFATANGASFFEWMANHPARGRAF